MEETSSAGVGLHGNGDGDRLLAEVGGVGRWSDCVFVEDCVPLQPEEVDCASLCCTRERAAILFALLSTSCRKVETHVSCLLEDGCLLSCSSWLFIIDAEDFPPPK